MDRTGGAFAPRRPSLAGTAALAALCASLLAACGGGATSGLTPDPLNHPGNFSAAIERQTDGLTLRLLPASFELGGRVQDLRLQTVPGDNSSYEVVVEGARDLKAVYLEVLYDPARFDPLSAQPSALLELGCSAEAGTGAAAQSSPGAPVNSLAISITDQPGIIALGQVLVRPLEQRGFSGDGAMARIELARRPFRQRRASDAPQAEESRTSVSMDNETRTLSWYYYSQGDYNQDSQVQPSDLTPIGLHFLKVVPTGEDELLGVVDGNRDGFIRVTDLSPIGINFRRVTEGYNVYYSSNSVDFPADDEPSTIEPALVLDFDGANGDLSAERLWFSCTFPPSLPDGVSCWVRPFHDDNEGIVSDTAVYHAISSQPLALLASDINSGDAPLTVNFDASGSSDGNGSIVSYEYDWDGTGSGEAFEHLGNDATPAHTFLSPGVFEVALRVTDNESLSAVDTLTITVTGEAVVPPNANLQAAPEDGDIPLSVDFDASGSSDDGSIVLYEYDLDGDNVYEVSENLPTPQQHVYAADGEFIARLRVTDNSALTAVDTVVITAFDAESPVANLGVTPLSGPAPLDVDFDASSSFSPLGENLTFEWDFDGDGSFEFDSGALAVVQHTYNTAGNYSPRVRVTDESARSDTAEGFVSVGDNGPVALLLADPRFGPVPLQVSFDASYSSTVAASITKYEWDFDGDGTFDLDNGTTATVQHTYNEAGVFDAMLRVTDSDNRTATKIMLVMPTLDNSFPPQDCIFALPSQSHAQAGEVVTVEVFTRGAGSKFLYMTGCGVTVETGNTYVPFSFDAGAIDGENEQLQDFIYDGVWAVVGATDYLFAPDSFIQTSDIGGGRSRTDFNMTPLDGNEIDLASGALFNFGLLISSSVSISFQRVEGVDRTYYGDAAVNGHYWDDDDNSGLPGISLDP